MISSAPFDACSSRATTDASLPTTSTRTGVGAGGEALDGTTGSGAAPSVSSGAAGEAVTVGAPLVGRCCAKATTASGTSAATDDEPVGSTIRIDAPTRPASTSAYVIDALAIVGSNRRRRIGCSSRWYRTTASVTLTTIRTANSAIPPTPTRSASSARNTGQWMRYSPYDIRPIHASAASPATRRNDPGSRAATIIADHTRASAENPPAYSHADDWRTVTTSTTKAPTATQPVIDATVRPRAPSRSR